MVLARALVQQPRILLLDEPTSALDVKHQLEVMRLLRVIAEERECVVIMVMHDLSLIEHFADDVILLKEGEIIAEGPTASTLTAENIEKAYGVKALIIETEQGSVVLPYERREHAAWNGDAGFRRYMEEDAEGARRLVQQTHRRR